MNADPRWADVDRHITEMLVNQDAALAAVLESSEAAGLPPISVSPPQGKLLWMLARLCGARRVLEIGTLAGYSTIWLARALPEGGRVLTLELDSKHAEVARANFARAGLTERIELRLGRASESLRQLATAGAEPFDLVFIDADKASSVEYFRRALELTRPGSLIITDNVVRGGAVVDAASTDPSVVGVRGLYDVLAAEPRVSATAIQTVGGKGYDGFAIALVIA